MSSSVTLGIHIVDILLYPVKQIPGGQTLAFVEQVRTTVAGSAVAVQRRSGNFFADLGLHDAEKLRIKTGPVVEIRRAMRTFGLNQQAAAKRMGIPQPKVSSMMHGDFTNLSERKLMECLNRLGYDIEIKVRPAAEPIWQLTLATV